MNTLLLRTFEAVLSPRVIVWRGATTSRAVALTFDDGPNPDFTGPVLDFLKRSGARATFFLVGEKVQARPDLVHRIVAEGHEVGSHSYRHESFRGKSLHWIAGEMKRNWNCLEPFLKGRTSSQIFRPPYGALSLPLLLWVILHRVRIVLWSSDPEDFCRQTGAEIMHYFEEQSLRAGDIVLLHDKTQATLDALEPLMVRLKRQGLGLTTVSELLGGREPPRVGIVPIK